MLIPGINVTQGAGNWYGLGAHDVGGSVGDIAGILRHSRRQLPGLPHDDSGPRVDRLGERGVRDGGRRR